MIDIDSFPIKGDISRKDAIVLFREASLSNCIFEFGMGGSTIILSFTPTTLYSFESDKTWYARTTENIQLYSEKLDIPINYNKYFLVKNYKEEQIVTMFNTHKPSFIFLDCEVLARFYLLDTLFPLSAPGTVFLIHDSRRKGEAKQITNFVRENFNHISCVYPVYRESNSCKIIKGNPLPYEDWNITEKDDNRVNWNSKETGL